MWGLAVFCSQKQHIHGASNSNALAGMLGLWHDWWNPAAKRQSINLCIVLHNSSPPFIHPNMNVKNAFSIHSSSHTEINPRLNNSCVQNRTLLSIYTIAQSHEKKKTKQNRIQFATQSKWERLGLWRRISINLSITNSQSILFSCLLIWLMVDCLECRLWALSFVATSWQIGLPGVKIKCFSLIVFILNHLQGTYNYWDRSAFKCHIFSI